MWANTVWGFLGQSIAFVLAGLGAPAEAFWLYSAAVVSLIISIAFAISPIFTTVGKLDPDSRFLMAVEGIELRKGYFGPFRHDDGTYSYMSWDRVRQNCDKLLGLGLIKVSTDSDTHGQYTWTWLGERVLKQLSKDDAKLPN